MRRPSHVTTRVTFARHAFRRTAKYKCSACGRNYQRSVTREWTENPFHEWRGRETELNKKAIASCVELLQTAKCTCGQDNRAKEGSIR